MSKFPTLWAGCKGQSGGSPSSTFEAELEFAPGTYNIDIVADDGTHQPVTQSYSITVADNNTNQTLNYDADGNLLSDGSRSYEWDEVSRLIKITEGTHETQFEYDGMDRRVRIIESDNGVEQSNHVYLWEHSQIVQRRDATGVSVERNYFGSGFEENGSAYYYTKDHLGSIREVVASDGTTIEAAYEYSPWEDVTKISGSGVESDFLYTGHFQHNPSNLHLTYYRAYSSEFGRWLSRDPIAENGGINLYAYVRNDPVNYWDPLGLDALILNDSGAVLGQGHNGILVGNNQDGWLYSSKNGERGYIAGVEKFDLQRFSTKQEFLNDPASSRYNNISSVPTTRDQDLAMQSESIRSVGEEYGMTNNLGESCSGHVDNVLDAGGINAGGRLRPNSQYKKITKLPNSSTIR